MPQRGKLEAELEAELEAVLHVDRGPDRTQDSVKYNNEPPAATQAMPSH